MDRRTIHISICSQNEVSTTNTLVRCNVIFRIYIVLQNEEYVLLLYLFAKESNKISIKRKVTLNDAGTTNLFMPFCMK